LRRSAFKRIVRRHSKEAMMSPSYTVHAVWDDEAGVWAVTDSDVPGLTAEAPTMEELNSKLRERIPELIRLNQHLLTNAADDGKDFPFHLMAERTETLRYA
jgi:hypothetical protein